MGRGTFLAIGCLLDVQHFRTLGLGAELLGRLGACIGVATSASPVLLQVELDFSPAHPGHGSLLLAGPLCFESSCDPLFERAIDQAFHPVCHRYALSTVHACPTKALPTVGRR